MNQEVTAGRRDFSLHSSVNQVQKIRRYLLHYMFPKLEAIL